MSDLMHEYHRRSDHGRDGSPVDAFLCDCRAIFAAHDARVRAEERAKLALEAHQRGDIGKPGQIEVWTWLRSESAANCNPRFSRTDGAPA